MATLPKSEFEKRVAKARKRVRSMDRVDGFEDRFLGTILSALEAGIRNPESGAEYDAYVMLQDVCDHTPPHQR